MHLAAPAEIWQATSVTQGAAANGNRGAGRRTKTWVSDTANAAAGYGREILSALGIDDIDSALSKRKFFLPGSAGSKPKAKINDPETGWGQDDESGQKWADYLGLAAIVQGNAKPSESAEWLAGVIRFDIPTVAPRSKANGKSKLPKGPELKPFNPTKVGMYLLKQGHKPDKALELAGRLKDAGVQMGEYRCKTASCPDKWDALSVICFPVWGELGSAADPVNWIAERTDGELLYAWTPKGEPDPDNPRPKRKCIGGKARGIIGDIRQIYALSKGNLPEGPCIKTEGVSDWMAAMLRDDLPDGAMVWTNPFGCRDVRQTWERDPWSFDLFRGREVWVIHDADKPGQIGAIGERLANGKHSPGWCQRLAEAGATCKNVTLPFKCDDSHGSDLRDWLRNGPFSELIERAAKSEAITPIKESESSQPTRDKIAWTDNEKLLVEASIRALAKSPDVFQRGGELFDVTMAQHPLSPDESVLQVRRLPLAHLRTVLSSLAQFIAESKSGESHPKTITDTLTRQIDSYASYPGISELWSVAEYPFLRPDGSVCTESGYDAATRTYLKTNLRANVLDKPTRADAIEAARRILDLVCDFAFKEGHHRSAWLAGLLTVFAKPAIRGCCPLFIIEASMQGSGKTRLADLISMIAKGRLMTRNPWPSRDEELAKSITAIVSSGIPTVLFDNCKTVLGGQSLEALGTAETWKSRILGESRETPEMPVRQVFFFTGNNCSVTADVARRGCFTRLEPDCEAPDERDDFRHTDLLGHALKNRESLVADVLTILRAFRLSGDRPHVKRWGGFEQWSELIRGAIIWLSLPEIPDPVEGTISMKKDTHASDVFGDLLDGLQEAGLDPSEDDSSITTAEILERIPMQNGYGDFVNKKLRDAIQSACGEKKCTTQRVGMILKRYDGRILQGIKFFAERNTKNVTVWRIVSMNPGTQEPTGASTVPRENDFSEREISDTHKTNIQGAVKVPAGSGVPAKCSPTCKEVDRITEGIPGSQRVICGICGKFYGRVPDHLVTTRQTDGDG